MRPPLSAGALRPVRAMMHDNLSPACDDAVDFEPLTSAIDRVAAGIARTAADQQNRNVSAYLHSPPLTTRERDWADRARLAVRLLERLDPADAAGMSPTIDSAVAALRAIVADAGRALSHRA